MRGGRFQYIMIKQFDWNHVEEIEWDTFRNGHEVKDYVLEMMETSSQTYVKNVVAEISILAIDDLLLPITKTIPTADNSYVVSPYTQYVSYAIEELWELNHRFLEVILKILLKMIGIVFKVGKIDDVVIVNNWLLSTNLYEEMTDDQAERIMRYLQTIYPNHAIIYRSLIMSMHNSIIQRLEKNGALSVPSRSIYIFSPENLSTLKKHQRKRIRQDYKYLQQSGYTIVENKQITVEDIPKILSLYNGLYLEKYSYYNPQFTEMFIKQAWQENLLTFKLLKKGDQIDGAVGFVVRNGVMTTPILGYDLTLPKEVGLYCLCSMLLTDHSLTTGLTLHRSGGAGKFKSLRGAVNEIEYAAVNVKHLSWGKKLMWKSLQIILSKIAVPLLKKLEL